MALLLLSQGTPMLLAGDEVLRTQGGNNNAWCQDNETSWFDWRLTETNGDMLNFVRQADRPAAPPPEPVPARVPHRPASSRPAASRTLPGTARCPASRPGTTAPATSPSRWRAAARRKRTSTCSSTCPTGASRWNCRQIPGRRWHLAVDTARESPWDIVAAGRPDHLDRAALPQPAAERGGAGGALTGALTVHASTPSLGLRLPR